MQTETTTVVRTLTTRKGLKVLTALNDGDALELLRRVDSDFARQLVSKHRLYGLSPDQLAWAHRLVYDAGLAVLDGDQSGGNDAGSGTDLRQPRGPVYVELPG